MATKSPNSQISRDQIENALRLIIEYLDSEPDREGLIKTPKRILKAWDEMLSGEKIDEEEIINGAIFTDGACKEMVILKNIQCYSFCEHHFLPFLIKCHIGYLPNGKVIGASKLARIVEIFARRLQIQERLVGQIADLLEKVLQPTGVMVVAEGKHICISGRGVRQTEAELITSAIRGKFWDAEVRNEFLNLIKG